MCTSSSSLCLKYVVSDCRTICSHILLQARSAELLQLHTDLRRTMFGTSSLARMTRWGVITHSCSGVGGGAYGRRCSANAHALSCSASAAHPLVAAALLQDVWAGNSYNGMPLLCRGVLPSYIPLDLLKFLKLWDYEGSLSSEVGVGLQPLLRPEQAAAAARCISNESSNSSRLPPLQSEKAALC